MLHCLQEITTFLVTARKYAYKVLIGLLWILTERRCSILHYEQ